VLDEQCFTCLPNPLQKKKNKRKKNTTTNISELTLAELMKTIDIKMDNKKQQQHDL